MRMRWGKRHALTEILQLHGLSACIQTAYIERLNLTLCQGVALLTRKTWSLPASDAHCCSTSCGGATTTFSCVHIKPSTSAHLP